MAKHAYNSVAAAATEMSEREDHLVSKDCARAISKMTQELIDISLLHKCADNARGYLYQLLGICIEVHNDRAVTVKDMKRGCRTLVEYRREFKPELRDRVNAAIGTCLDTIRTLNTAAPETEKPQSVTPQVDTDSAPVSDAA